MPDEISTNDTHDECGCRFCDRRRGDLLFIERQWQRRLDEQRDETRRALKLLGEVRSARDRIYEIAKGTFALHLMTKDLAVEMDDLRHAGDSDDA